MLKETTKKIVITGGHHSSALPVIDELHNILPEIELVWFGHKFSMARDINPTLEYREITALNIPFYDLKAGKFYKTYDIVRLLKIPFGFFQALYFLLKVHPCLILSFGGYLAVPVVIAGWFLGIPSITHEQTLATGYANKVIALFAKKILVSWPQSLAYFDPKKTVYTGLPLRKAILKATTTNFQLNSDLPTIYLTAGKTGAHLLNSLVLELLPELLNTCNIIHQTGDHSEYKDYDALVDRYAYLSPKPLGKYYVRKFITDEIGEAFTKANLVMSRAGAHIITELLFLQKPALLIPIPWVSHNEQFMNAKLLEETGLAYILPEKELSTETLKQTLFQMLQTLEKYKIQDPKILEGIKQDAASRIVQELKVYLVS